MKNEARLILDIKELVGNTSSFFNLLRGRRIFITGGTGFFGKWFLEYFKYLNSELDAGIEVFILTRNIERFKYNHVDLYNTVGLNFQEGDIRNFDFKFTGIDYIIHAATDASAKVNDEQPQLMTDSIVNGMCRLLQYAKFCGAHKVLMTSSGAVYGDLASVVGGAREDMDLAFNQSGTAYSKGKRLAEIMGCKFSSEYGVEFKIARCFTFVGPYMPLRSFAINSFLDNASRGEDIVIEGDGTAVRSYMYPTDLITCLLTVLFLGNSTQAYNVGSDQAITLKDLAYKISGFYPGISVKIMNGKTVGVAVNHYVPNIMLISSLLKHKTLLSIDTILDRVIDCAHA